MTFVKNWRHFLCLVLSQPMGKKNFPAPLNIEQTLSHSCTTIYRYPNFSTRYSVMCKVYTGYHGTSEIEHDLCACTVNNPLAKAWEFSVRTGAQSMLYMYLVKARGLSFRTGAQTMFYLVKARGLSLRTGAQTMLYLVKARGLSPRTGAQTMLHLSRRKLIFTS